MMPPARPIPVLVALIVFWAAALCYARATPADWTAAGPVQAALAEAALARTQASVVYDGSYQVIDYPGGDIDADKGVCTDVLIRAYRTLNIDLQVLVHEDMERAFRSYPDDWGLSAPDSNIDHRRVPNLQTFFERHGVGLPISEAGLDYRPGDIVTWVVGGSLPHIGIVSDLLNQEGTRPLIVHNIGAGPRLEDMLFDYPVTGHYRYPASPID